MKVNRNKLINVINEKWRTKNCILCGANNWTIDDKVVAPLSVGKNASIELGGKIIPLVAVTCNECGNTIFLNPLVINAIDE